MSLKAILKKEKKRKNTITIEANIGWAGIKPAATRSDKINQIKTENIDDSALLVVGTTADDFSEYPQISADISVHDLIEQIDNLSSKKSKKKSLLVITGLDQVSAAEQEKFVCLLKDRQIMSSKLPDYVQIVMPVLDADAVSNVARSLSFELKV